MKLLKILTLSAGLFFVQTVIAQNPAISARYSNEEIAQMIKTYQTSHSHDVVPPDNLQQKFQLDFPKAHDVEWEMAHDIYEVEFEISFRDFKAFYDANGNLLMTREEIRHSELPAIVKNAAESKYPKYAFDDIYKIRRGTEVFYNIEMEHGKMEVKLSIKSDGTVVKERVDY
jgi:hypothetical protein